MTEQNKREARIFGPNRIGAGTLLAWDVIVGHPSKATLLCVREFAALTQSVFPTSDS